MAQNIRSLTGEDILRALIVDANADNRAVMVELIKARGHNPVEACCHEDAEELFSSLEFDYFLINLLIPLSNGGENKYGNGITLIDKIRDYYPKSVEYPVIVISNSVLDDDDRDELMEVGTNCFLPFVNNIPEDRTKLRRAIRRLTEKASAKRKTNKIPGSHQKVDATPVLEKLIKTHKLVVDLKAREVYFNGIQLPSGIDGLQLRHKNFLFILGRNPGRAMSHEEIHKEIRKFFLRDFKDRPSNIRSQIKKVLKDLAKKYPDEITEHNINSLFITEPEDKTILTLLPKDIFTIYGDEKYPSL